MNNKLYKGLLAVTTSVMLMAAPKTIKAEGQYKLNNNVKSYVSAYDAKNNRNKVGQYKKGSYYVYSRSNGMINISHSKNTPGAWINPKENTKAQVASKTTTKKTTSKTVKASQKKTNTAKAKTYKLNKNLRGYTNAYDASQGRNSNTTCKAGNYYIYKEHKGMLNVSKVKNQPGAWINPNAKAVSKATNNSGKTTVAKSTGNYKKVYTLPNNMGTFKSYMGYNAITNRRSPQWRLQQKAHTGNYGVRMVNGRYMVAMSNKYGNVGDSVDIVLSTGRVVPAIIGDIKASSQVDYYGRHGDGSLVEFIVDMGSLHRTARIYGSLNPLQPFNGAVKQVKVL